MKHLSMDAKPSIGGRGYFGEHLILNSQSLTVSINFWHIFKVIGSTHNFKQLTFT